jgi:hypothetical protein
VVAEAAGLVLQPDSAVVVVPEVFCPELRRFPLRTMSYWLAAEQGLREPEEALLYLMRPHSVEAAELMETEVSRLTVVLEVVQVEALRPVDWELADQEMTEALAYLQATHKETPVVVVPVL